MIKSLKIGSQTLTWGTRTYVMGIINLTPDSFSGDGLLAAHPAEAAQAGLDLARRFIEAGADILDIGAESTRPGALPVGAQEETSRLVPLIRLLRAELPEALISVDTYKAAVADASLGAGAHLLNDVWGLRADPDMAAVAARHHTPVILMHNRSNPASVEVRANLGNAYIAAPYQDMLAEVKAELLGSVAIARRAGIADEHILLDPGIGFGKSVAQNLELIRRLYEIRALGFPVLLGASRKSFIGYTLDLPPDQRVEGTLAAVAVGITRGADIVRVHDVEAVTRVARMTDALVRA